ncbi:MAG TPA: MarR family transcriptional regulator [Chthonomonadaceae bacterium]|nr:MarR family transcriptional regulator [Chthonomonadaceae bacterium]
MGTMPRKPQAETESVANDQEALVWLEAMLPRIMRRLMDSENLDMPLLQLPLAQLRLAQALYDPESEPEILTAGETMGRLSERLGVRQNALTQAADRLINHGLAERLSDPRDRRVVRLRLTQRGREWVEARRARRRARLSQLWSLLDPRERLSVLQAVRTLEAAADRLEKAGAAEPASGEPERKPLPTIEETLRRFTLGAVTDAAAPIKA